MNSETRTTTGPRWAANILVVGCVGILGALNGFAQAVTVASVGEGTEIILVTEPFTEMAAACWSAFEEQTCITGTDLVFLADLEDALGSGPPPAALIAVGGSARTEVLDLVTRIVGERPAAAPIVPHQSALTEGGQERRLGPPGTASNLRLHIPLPPPQTRDRTAMIVLWELLPRALSSNHTGIRGRISGNIAELELTLDDESPDLALRRLRLDLARFGADPSLSGEEVEAAAQRLRIERRARLENGEPAARELLELWLAGGAAAVREHLFGPDGVTVDSVESVSRNWLAQHPGHAIIVLPPHVFRPRFVPAPQEIQLDNDVTAAILERPGAGLSSLVLRPVLLAGLDGDVESTILTRVARHLRGGAVRPPFIAVEATPPRLELAAAEDSFPALCESLQEALEAISADDQEVTPGEDARSRALRLMSGVLGLNTGTSVTPSTVLTPGNLALGVVAPDSESAIESLQKFGIGGPSKTGAPVASTVEGSPRRRLPTAGTRTAIAIAGEVTADFPVRAFVGSLVEQRIGALIENVSTEVLAPLVPGRTVLVILVEGEDTVDNLESRIRQSWSDLVAPVDEAELDGVRREVANEITSFASGVIGRARACAEVAAGLDRWRSPSEREMAAMMIDAESVNAGLAELAEAERLEWTASGPLPVAVSP